MAPATSVARAANMSDTSPGPHPRPPHWGLLAMECRAPWEFACALAAAPVLARAPQGDGHAVVVFPGLVAGDTSTLPLRSYLSRLNYQATGWAQGPNLGPRAGVLDRATAHVRQAAETSGRKVSLLGWSLGGVYAREIAKLAPECVRAVVTLGTPFAGGPKSTHAWHLFEMLSGCTIEGERAKYRLHEAPPVPTTSVYSRSDGIVAWQGSVQAPCPHNPQIDNVEVRASHIGIGLNPAAWWVVADRLAQAQGQWQAFDRQGIRWPTRHLFPDPLRA